VGRRLCQFFHANVPKKLHCHFPSDSIKDLLNDIYIKTSN
jgi:hypothetical protein